MKLTPTTFYMACKDGLFLLQGHEFEACGRIWVVHKDRPPFDEFEPSYLVSDKESGMKIPGMPCIRSRVMAAKWAKATLEQIGAEAIEASACKAMEIRSRLKIIESP